MKKEKLIGYHEQIIQWQAEGNVHEFFNRTKIIEFNKNYAATVERVQKDIIALQQLFMEFAPNGLILRSETGQAIFHKGRTVDELNKFFHEMMDQDHTENGYEILKTVKQYIAENPDGPPAPKLDGTIEPQPTGAILTVEKGGADQTEGSKDQI